VAFFPVQNRKGVKHMSVLDMNKLVHDVTEKYDVHKNIAEEVRTIIQHARTQNLSDEDYELLLTATIVNLAHDYALDSAARLVTKVLEAYGKNVLPESEIY
jgi:hypothetical protein